MALENLEIKYYHYPRLKSINYPKLNLFNQPIESIGNILRFKNVYQTTEEIYQDMFNLNSPPLCKCGEIRKYLSVSLGYYEFCSYEKHYAEITKRAHDKRTITVQKIKLQEANDNKVSKICFLCGNEFSFDKRKFVNGRNHCFNRSCVSTIRNNQNLFNFFEVFNKENFMIYKRIVKYRLNKEDKEFVFEQINKIDDNATKFGMEISERLFFKKALIYKDNILTKKPCNNTKYFSLFENNFKEECVFKKCIICGTDYLYEDKLIFDDNHSEFKKVGAFHTCSKPCYEKIRANSLYFPNMVQTPEKRLKRSNDIKNKILKGTFTPNVTNSWAKSRCYVDGIPFRSSWEAYFYLFNKINGIILEYEKLRVLYTFEAKNHIYIVDFIDELHNIVYEIKPFSCLDDEKVRLKEQSAKAWCLTNNLEFVFISDDWFLKNFDENLLKLVEDKTTFEKMKRNLKQFKGNK